MSNEQTSQVPLPDYVSISVAELYKLREEAALLAALRIAKVEDWHGYQHAKWLFDNDPDLWNIKQGWKGVHDTPND